MKAADEYPYFAINLGSWGHMCDEIDRLRTRESILIDAIEDDFHGNAGALLDHLRSVVDGLP